MVKLMGLPKVSIIWLNYNSTKIIDLALESLNAISELDYPTDKYELIVVDNCSTDGSFEKIKEFLGKKSGLRKKIIKLSSNLGFTGGNNIGFKARDKESKYVAILNNDAVPFKESLRTMVEYAEQYNVGSLNGIVLKLGQGNVIDTAGSIITEALNSYLVGAGNPAPWIIKKPFYITYASGVYALYKVNCILRCMNERMFFDEFFGYMDDTVLGLMLWNSCNSCCRVIAIPQVVAKHQGGASFRGYGRYLDTRNRVALSYVTNTRYRHLIKLHTIRSTLLGWLRPKSPRYMRAFYDGVKLGRILRDKHNIFIDIYKAPILKISLREFIMYHLAGTRKRLLRLYEEKTIKLIKRWEVD